MKLSELKVIVTGAASGMGRHFALEFSRAGARVAACDINGAGLDDLSTEAQDAPGELRNYVFNVAEESSVVSTVAAAAEDFGGLNGLVNNAGIFRDGLLIKRDRTNPAPEGSLGPGTRSVTKMSLEQWQSVIDVDLTGPFLMTREVVAQMVERSIEPGVVINISSVSRAGNVGQSNYSAAKAGLVADTVLWAKELSRYGIRVAAIAPGFVRTPILEAMRPEVLEKMLKGVPLGRLGEPAEIFAGIRFIVECVYFTGRCLDIDGGVTL